MATHRRLHKNFTPSDMKRSSPFKRDKARWTARGRRARAHSGAGSRACRLELGDTPGRSPAGPILFTEGAMLTADGFLQTDPAQMADELPVKRGRRMPPARAPRDYGSTTGRASRCPGWWMAALSAGFSSVAIGAIRTTAPTISYSPRAALSWPSGRCRWLALDHRGMLPTRQRGTGARPLRSALLAWMASSHEPGMAALAFLAGLYAQIRRSACGKPNERSPLAVAA